MKKGEKMRVLDNDQGGFTLIEVAVASIITMVGLVFLASLFTLAITQNRVVKQFTSTTALAQEKIEELNAIDYGDKKLNVGGDLDNQVSVNDVNYFDEVFVDDQTGEVKTGAQIPQGQVPHYRRFWRIENDPELLDTVIISVRVAALQAGRNTGMAEETTLATVRSH
ncbi:MAG TPA: prepilin-type N-terminal cleavage/methylation domain-containing protein [Blastocatellia bacterium]|nr:prepilin-type N-terminal cleavage/methylation domain-containing protein [Blastocatellia bacterium]